MNKSSVWIINISLPENLVQVSHNNRNKVMGKGLLNISSLLSIGHAKHILLLSVPDATLEIEQIWSLSGEKKPKH